MKIDFDNFIEWACCTVGKIGDYIFFLLTGDDIWKKKEDTNISILPEALNLFNTPFNYKKDIKLTEVITEDTSTDSHLVTDLAELGTSYTDPNQGYFPPIKIIQPGNKYIPVQMHTEFINYKLDLIQYSDGVLGIKILSTPTDKVYFLSRFELLDI